MKFFISVAILFMLSLQLYAQSGINPFDIERNDSVQIEIDTISEALPALDTKIQDENPFSVSHIPIRKNQYEEIERLATTNREAEESISITYLPLWIVIFSMSLLAFILVRRKSHIYMLARTLFNENLMRQKAYEENKGLSLIYICGYLLFLINLSLFIFLVAGSIFSSFTAGFFNVLMWVSLFMVGKHIVLSVFSRLYEFNKEADTYSFTINTIYNFIAPFYLALNVILLFGPDSWIQSFGLFGILIFTLFLISRYYKGLGIARKYLSQHIFHFFLYFCAFEFSPWLIIYGMLRDIV